MLIRGEVGQIVSRQSIVRRPEAQYSTAYLEDRIDFAVREQGASSPCRVANSLPHVEDKIEARFEAFRRFRHAHHQIAAE
jgi:hypothetical protein